MFMILNLSVGGHMPIYSTVSKSLKLTTILCLASAASAYAADNLIETSPTLYAAQIDAETSNHTHEVSSQSSQDIYNIFSPKKHTLNTSFDYGVWDKALENRVIPLGLSLRRNAPRLKAEIGTRLIKRSQNSKYRLEGSRVTFYSFTDGFIDVLTEYKEDLIRLAHEHDIQSFSRNEQLAYWINLHNVVLIETIAKEHPVRKPSKLVLGSKKETLHIAKLIKIKDVPLSLKNIRENIVYENWDNPNVIYGFFRGDIGGPGLSPYAVTADNVDFVLETHGFEYITSLRGFQTTSFDRKISYIYNEARPYFFPNWPHDLEAHFKDYLEDHHLLGKIQEDKPLSFISYDTTIADLWGGDRTISSKPTFSTRGLGKPPVLFEYKNKFEELKRKNLHQKQRTVIIEDIETEDKTP